MAWTDERTDDFASRVDAGFERVDRSTSDLKAQMDLRFTRVDNDLRDLRREVRRFGIALMVGLVGVIAALMGAIATGALAG